MAGAQLWSQVEDDFIQRRVALGNTNPQLYRAFVKEFGNVRSNHAVVKRRANLHQEEPLPDADDQVRFDEDDDSLDVTVVSAGDIKTIEQLRAAADVDLEIWEEHKADIRNRYQAMKDEKGKPLVIEIRYIKIEYRRKAATWFDMKPVILKIVRPRVKKPRKTTKDVSVHFGDKHIPFDDPRNTSIMHQILEITDPTTVVDHGDTLDCEQISKYPKDPFTRTALSTEIERGAQHFGEVASLVRPGTDLLWFEGNHEERLTRVVWEMADRRAYGELMTLPTVQDALRWESLLGLDSLGWRMFPYKSDGQRKNFHVLHDRLVLKHGATTGKGVAEKEYNKYGKSGLSGHMHRMEVYSRRDWNGQHQWHCIPMLGSIRDDYVDHANWQAGLMVVTWSPRKDRFAFEPVQIIDGECYFRGVHLRG